MMQQWYARNSKVLGSLLIMVTWLAMSTASVYAQNTVTKVTLVVTDAQGNVLMTTDSHGNVLARYTYRPYGTQQSGPTNAGPGYTGHVNDPNTGLVYMQQRYYDPQVGRFISPDPVAPTPGNIFNFGRYTYANDNPFSFVDPSGKYACGKNTSKVTCAKIRNFVSTLHKALERLNKKSARYKRLEAVSRHIGTYNDNNGVVLNAGQLPDRVIAEANSVTLMTVDVKQAAPLSALFSKYNPNMGAAALTNAFGAEAIAHEGQHQLDYLNPSIGYPTGRKTEYATELRAYGTEIGVAQGLGVTNALYRPGTLRKYIKARIRKAAKISTDYWCKANGC